MIVSCDDEIGVIIVYMSDFHSVRASKIILLLVFTVVLITCASGCHSKRFQPVYFNLEM
jgi:hypothetical protein